MKLRVKAQEKKIIWHRKSEEKDKTEIFSCFVGENNTIKQGYSIHWIHSNLKAKQDYQSREALLKKTDTKLEDLAGKLNARNLKTKEQIQSKIDTLLKGKVHIFIDFNLSETKEYETVQIGRGRPGPNSKYKTITKIIYAFSWSRNKQALRQEKNVDGIFPLLCTDKTLSAKEALKAYKYQPRLEKRFSQFKKIHKAAPLLCKKIRRVEALMFLFFPALILQAVIEREIRSKMKDNDIDSLPIYPEGRLCSNPTTSRIFDEFEDLSTYKLQKNSTTIEEFTDELSDKQREILNLLQIPETLYWPN